MKLKRLMLFLIVILFLAMLSYYWPKINPSAAGDTIKDTVEFPKEPAYVLRAVDGDTLKVRLENRTEETIRLLGINTPEKNQPYYQEAKQFLIQFENTSVELLRDKEDIDRYDRKLRYVFVGDRILNVEILENGLATSFMISGLKYQDKLMTADNLSRKNNLGLWKKSEEDCSRCIILKQLDSKNDFFIIENQCDFDCDLKDWTVKDDANHFFEMKNLQASQEMRYDSPTKVWNDEGDRFFMRDNLGGLVIYYTY